MRLILKYNVSDEFTYSYDVITPFVYESAEKALVDLENLLRSKVDHSVEKDKLLEKTTRIIQQLAAPGAEKMAEAKKQALLAEWESYRTKIAELSAQESDTFIFAKQKLYYSNFRSVSEGKVYIELPDILTVDEFFKEAEY